MGGGGSGPARDLSRAHGLPALAVVFFACGAALASWFPHIPAVQARLGVGPGPLGFALLGLAVGALFAMPAAGFLLPRVGSRALVAVTLPGLCLGLPLPVLAPSTATLGLALTVVGAFAGALDVSMNAHAVAVERALGRPVLSRLHALYPLGGLAGAGLAALALHYGLTPLRHILLSAAALGAVAAVAIGRLEPASSSAVTGGGRLAGPTRPVLALGLIAFCGLLAEGAMGDWAALWLFESLRTSAAVAACGFAVFSLAMAAGRLGGDHLVARQGEACLLRTSGIVAAVSLGLALVIGRPAAALAGCVGMGLGLANVVPIVFRAAAHVPGLPPGYGLAATTTVGYCGLIAGPPFIGLIAAATSLPTALGLVTLACAAVGALAAALPGQGRPNVFPKKLPGFQRGASGSDATA